MPIATYVSKTWTLTKAVDETLVLFERTISISVFGALQNEGQ
jgi:hypothetical protein